MEDIPQEIVEERHGSSRRDFLKKSAITGAVVWSAPAISTLSSKAWGAHSHQPDKECAECVNCKASAAALRALGLEAGSVSAPSNATQEQCKCVLNQDLKVQQVGGASAQVACGKADHETCSASSYVAGLRVRIADNAFLESTVLSSCVACGSGASFLAKLDLVVTVAGIKSVTNLELPASDQCNAKIAIPGFPLVVVVFNEQFCKDGVLTVRALRVTVAGLNVIAAESKAGGAGCPCQACAGAAAECAPPRSQLC